MSLAEASPRSAPQGVEPPPPNPTVARRLRLGAVCAVLTALAFVQDPGSVAADTKLDLYVDPASFLGKALHLWEPLGFFGQLQNQAYGYLFPMGPFYLVGEGAGLPVWVVQRLWWSLLLCAAFLGAATLARMLGTRTAAAPVLAGVAYALAPRMVTEISVVSVEVLAFAVAPWVIVPLVSVATGRMAAVRGAALSGIAVLCAGGVNAVATAAVLPLGAWWILTRFRGRARWTLAGWWVVAVGLACLWWVVPLLTLGQYSPPFLDWIESSSVTTLLTSPDVVLRGASQWVAYVADAGGPVWPGGWQLVTAPLLVFAIGAAAALGIAGLALRSTPYRGFLLGLALLGFVLVSLGHVADVSGFLAEPMRDLLDGALAPLRNTHKFDLLIRLPLAIGVGFLADAVWQRAGLARPLRLSLIWSIALLIAVGAWPLATGQLARERSFTEIPAYWADAATWLADADPAGRALLVPGASFGVYAWGRTQDEPLQPLATSPWGVRDAVPLSSAGNIRWLDAVQERLDSGRGSPGLADALARAGVRYVVVRNDIDQRRSDTPRTVLVRQALARSGGFVPVAGFGPALPPYRTEGLVIDYGLQDTAAAIEIWRVDSPYAAEDARIWLRDATDLLVTSGSAESVIDLADADVLGATAVATAGDEEPFLEAGLGGQSAVTDGYLRTEVGVGSPRNNRSEAMTADQAFRQDRRVHDYYPVDPSGRQAVAEFGGGTLTASSSGSDPTALRSRDPAAQPWSAVDGDPTTAWVSGDLQSGVGQWWQVEADEPFAIDSIDVRFLVSLESGQLPTEVTVTTDAGEITVPVEATDSKVTLPVPPGETRVLRLTLAAVADGSNGDAFGLREVDLPFDVTRLLRTAGVADGGPIVLTARRGEQSSCTAVAGQLVCSPVLGRAGEERSGVHRMVTVARDGDYRVRIAVRPRPGAALDTLLTPIAGISPVATASSVATSDPASRPQSAVDGVASTAWVASPLDLRPELDIRWGERREIRGIKLDVSSDLPASRPLKVTVTVNGVETTGVVSDRGILDIPPQTSDEIGLRFDNAVATRSLDPATGYYITLPIGVNEVRVIGAQDIAAGPRLFDRASVSCGFGPQLEVDGVAAVSTAVTATVSQIVNDVRLAAVPCEGRTVRLTAGTHDLSVASTEEFAVESVVLEPVSATARLVAPATPTILEWTGTERSVDIPAAAAPRLLETGENANAGWTATLGGQPLEAVRVDGWRQAWLVPAGAGGVANLSFEPDQPYRAGLLAGLLAVLALLALALLPGRWARRPAPAPGIGPPGRLGIAALAAGGVVSAALVGGFIGLAAALIALGAAYLLGRWAVALACGLAAAVVAATMPWPALLQAPAWQSGLAAGLAIAAVAAATGPARRRCDDGDGGPKTGVDARSRTTRR